MDDDQFHGNLNVQGGNPEPADAPTDDLSASSLGTSNEATNIVETVVEEAPAEEEKPEEPESEMSRRMNEILGSFDEGIATEKAISSGNGKVVNGTAVRVDAPKPDFATNAPAEAIQADVTKGTEGVFDTTTAVVPEAAPVAPAEVNNSAEGVAPEAASAMPVEPVQPIMPMGTGETPVMTGVPRSNIEQAAAEKAAREAAAAAANKKIDPKILIGIIVSIVVIIAASVVIVISLSNKGKKTSGEVAPVVVEDEPEPEVKREMQRIGTPEHGYINVPKDWKRVVEGVTGTQFSYGDEDKDNTVTIDSQVKNATTTAELVAKKYQSDAQAAGISMPQMGAKKVGELDGFKVYYYTQDTEKWTFIYVFESEDNRVHTIKLDVVKETDDLIDSVPESWSLNQNNTDSDKDADDTGGATGTDEGKTE